MQGTNQRAPEHDVSGSNLLMNIKLNQYVIDAQPRASARHVTLWCIACSWTISMCKREININNSIAFGMEAAFRKGDVSTTLPYFITRNGCRIEFELPSWQARGGFCMAIIFGGPCATTPG